ncbi:MAG: CAP domain-containing protein [Sulfurovum sp.]|uniref:CAP domain-containing protein n=1 Tax=Sulfurovum sp. TaxID=1969726 RepID=UPI002868369F|nr:CAP domain-containing protein [Sulfurovum sp.]MCO4844980.1 CAP domain-containing protein [Sulfurovum sp.]
MSHFFIILTLLLVSLEANSEKAGLAYLNKIRENTGLIKFKNNKSLQKSANSHAKYLIQNQRNGHYEKKGKYSYTGTSPSKRVIKAGYSSTYVMENLSVNTTGYVKSIDNLFSAIYHRFVFLNLDKDEIGLGFHSTKKKRKIKRAYVYDIGSLGISELCKRSFSMANGVYYMKNICKQSSKMIPKSLYEEKKDEVRRKNRDIILYPYAGQTHVWPAFYNESPDPLPGYKVSGFPLSVQFNPIHYKNVKLKSFRLYDAEEKEIKKIKILQQNNDHNHLLSKLEFALMPLHRLEFDTRYTVLFEAIADGSKVKKRWSFRTEKPQETVYRITEKKTKLTVPSASTSLLYIVPDSGKDILHSYRSRGGIKVSFLDQNTLKITFPKRRSSGRVSLDLGKKKVFFDVQ